MADTSTTPDPAATYLAQVRERATATKSSAHGYTPHGERFPSGPAGEWLIANLAAADDVPRLLAVVEAVLKLHVPVDRGRVMNCCRGCEEENSMFHEDCCHEWPCPTPLAVSAELPGEGER